MGIDDKQSEQSVGTLSLIEQETVVILWPRSSSVRLEDGRIAAVLRWLCEGLKLDAQVAMRRIQRGLRWRKAWYPCA